MAKMVVPDPLLGIIGFTFYLEDEDRNTCFIILSVDVFRRTYNSLIESQTDRSVFEWEEWGPSTTRWLPYVDIAPAGIRVTCGPRILVLGKASALADGGFDDSNLMILDFNPRPIRRGATTKLEKKYQILVIDHETEWEDPRSGLKITSRLPFRVFVSKGFSRGANHRFDGSTIVSRRVRLEPGVEFHEKITDIIPVWARYLLFSSSPYG
jgi:hypothetical protein